jgi:hypothetical protein
MEHLLEEIDKGIEDLNTSTGSDIPDALNSQRGSTDGAIPIKSAAISTPKIIAIIVVTIIIVGGGASAVLISTSDNLVIIEEIVPTPKSTSLIFPADGQRINDKTPTFDWEKVSHPIGIVYTLKIFKENEANAVFYKSEIKNSQFTLDEPLEDGTYLWHILLRDASWQKGPESETNTFHVGDSDVDNDGIADRQDNCRTNFNPDQKDDDNDGLGNVCDKTPYKDTDGDKIFDNVDECIDEPENYNHFQDEDGCPDITVGVMQPKTEGEFKTSTKLK